MKLYEITLQPMAGFRTPLKGDTIFGHFCWQLCYDPSLVDGGLEKQMGTYQKSPFVVFSSAFPKLVNSSTRYILKRPELPLSFLFSSNEKGRKERLMEAKEHKRRKWMVLEGELSIDLSKAKFLNDRELLQEAAKQVTRETRRQMQKVGPVQFITLFDQSHNTINRLTQTTGKGQFSPYSQRTICYYPETELVIFVLLDELATDIDRVLTALERIGQWGYGKDSSTGMGRFNLGEHEELSIPELDNANACYTLAPSVPNKNSFSKSWFIPFIRFGKHGDTLAHSANPFKDPVIMADEGAVFMPMTDSFFENPYLGRAIIGVSKSMPQTVAQGYAPYLPLKLEC